MSDVKKNNQINEELTALYKQHTGLLLSDWEKHFGEPRPTRVNEFGIIDEEKYDADDGILFICKETNGWDYDDFNNGILFRTWMQQITRHGFQPNSDVKNHPQTWYQINRWIKLMRQASLDLNELAQCKEVCDIGTIAFTNINKVRGRERSGKEYRNLARTDNVGEVLRREVEIIKPKKIVCCGTHVDFRKHVPSFSGQVLNLPHPGARFGNIKMLEKLVSQFK